jgi:hypothetical protein
MTGWTPELQLEWMERDPGVPGAGWREPCGRDAEVRLLYCPTVVSFRRAQGAALSILATRDISGVMRRVRLLCTCHRWSSFR